MVREGNGVPLLCKAAHRPHQMTNYLMLLWKQRVQELLISPRKAENNAPDNDLSCLAPGGISYTSLGLKLGPLKEVGCSCDGLYL